MNSMGDFMKTSLTILKAFLGIARLLGIAGAQQSGSEKKQVAPEMQAPKPGPEMERLRFLIGAWDVRGECEKTPLTGEGGKQTGWYKVQLGPGGFSILSDFAAEGPLGTEIGHEIITWDPKSDAYTTVTIGNNFPGALIGKARWEGKNLVTRAEFEMAGAVIHNRAVYSHVGEKTLQIEESIQMGDAPYELLWKASAAKK
jgi:hypothetical protein